MIPPRQMGFKFLFLVLVAANAAIIRAAEPARGANLSTPEARKMYVIGLVPDWDPTCSQMDFDLSARRWEQLTASADKNPALRGRIIVRILRGKDATPDGLSRILDGLDIGRKDSVVVYTAAHGTIDPIRGPVRGRLLVLNREGLGGRNETAVVAGMDLLERVARKQPRFAALLTDSCSSLWQDPDAPEQPRGIPGQGYPLEQYRALGSEKDIDAELLRILFFRPR